MIKKEKTMHEFYASYEIKIEDFIGYFDDEGFEYFYENVIRKMGKKPDVKFKTEKIKLDNTYEFGIDATGCVYKLIHVFKGLEIGLEFTVNLDYMHKICNMNMSYVIDGFVSCFEVNFYDASDFESECDKLLEMLGIEN